jgi:D-arabinonate dehydratase
MRVATEPFLRDRRVPLRAQSCVDCALHDAFGKLVGLPLHMLWGRAERQVRVTALGGYYREREELAGLAEEVSELKAHAIYGLKLKVGGRTPREDAERVAAVRRAGGEHFIVAADANQAWTREQAIDFARRVADLGLSWFEEPCKWDNDRRDMARVRAAGGIPVSAGQSCRASAAATLCSPRRSTSAISMRAGAEVRPSGAASPRWPRASTSA